MLVEGPEGERGGGDEGEEEGGRQPVDVGFTGVEVCGSYVGDRGEGDPVPGDDDVEEDKLKETKEAALVNSVFDPRLGGDTRECSDDIGSCCVFGRRRMLLKV